MHNNKNLAAK